MKLTPDCSKTLIFVNDAALENDVCIHDYCNRQCTCDETHFVNTAAATFDEMILEYDFVNQLTGNHHSSMLKMDSSC